MTSRRDGIMDFVTTVHISHSAEKPNMASRVNNSKNILNVIYGRSLIQYKVTSGSFS